MFAIIEKVMHKKEERGTIKELIIIEVEIFGTVIPVKRGCEHHV